MIRKALLVIILLLVALPAAAQGDPAAELMKEIWCPMCNGIRLDVCDLQVCDQMREFIHTELAAGRSKEEIKADFIDFYGPVVLGEPPREGFNLLAWIMPVVLLAGGMLSAVWLTRRWTNAQAPAPPGSSAPAQDQDQAAADSYLSQVERDLTDL